MIHAMATSGDGALGSRLAAAVVAGLVIAAAAVTAVSGVVATAGGNDQQHFHLPSVLQLRQAFPDIDLVHLPTASGPLYYVAVAGLSGSLGLGVALTQVVGSLFAAALAALTVWHARSVPTAWLRLLAVAPLLLSAYYWQSAIWMLTDDAAMLFTLSALLLLERDATTRRQIVVGLLIAAAVATRQTCIWAIIPAIAMCVYSGRQESWRDSARAVARVTVPAVVVLVALMLMWGGLTPPAMRDFNTASRSWISVSFVFAVAVVFAVPIAFAACGSGHVRRHARAAAIVGLIAAVPAIVFPSAATTSPDESRRGGVVWSVVANGPDIGGRSPVLMALAFAGGFACTLVFYVLESRTAVILASALVGLAIVTTAAAQLYQRYADLPIAMLAVLAIVALACDRHIQRIWPLVGLAGYQALMTVGIVVLPAIRAVTG